MREPLSDRTVYILPDTEDQVLLCLGQTFIRMSLKELRMIVDEADWYLVTHYPALFGGTHLNQEELSNVTT